MVGRGQWMSRYSCRILVKIDAKTMVGEGRGSAARVM